MTNRISRHSLLCATALFGIMGTPALAQTSGGDQDAPVASGEADDGSTRFADEIIVTGSRRRTTLQDAPINISAVSAEAIEDQRLDDIRSLASFTPGITVADTGPASTGNIILRGIASGDTSTAGSNTNNSVGVYLGEVPLYLDFKLIDISRVEVLQGPQGTLYGLGTLAGAVRYIPNRPETNDFTVDLHARGYAQSHSTDFGYIGDIAVNIPIVRDHIAFRTATGYFSNAGFIDNNYLLQEPGVSDPQPVRATDTSTGGFGGPTEYGQNFRAVTDVNYEHTFTSRNQLLLELNPGIKAYLTYAHQETKTGGQQATGAGVLGTGRYENPTRYLEPFKRTSDLFSGEIFLNLFDFAQLVSTTAYTKQKILNTDDNTDLLLDLDYGYEAFPTFSSYANNKRTYKQFNQEVRLVSTHGGPLNWVIGGFYNRLKFGSDRNEFTPGFAQYFDIPRPDNLEYISFVRQKTVEKAAYGEATFHITSGWQVTGGIRYFKYDDQVSGGSDTPLFGGGLVRMPYPSFTIDPSRVRSGQTGKDGFVWKANSSYKFSDNLLVYGTYSTGYRVGGVNRVVPCILPLPPGQNLCALPNELEFGPDKTRNMEVGVRAALFDRMLQLTLDAFRIEWSGVQVPSQTVNGAIGVTVNGADAISKGFDVQATLRLTPELSVTGSYSYVDAHLTEDVPGLVVSQGIRYDAFAGDRLPGSRKDSGFAQLQYSHPLGDGNEIKANWSAVYNGNIYSRVGLRGNGEIIPSYITHSASISFVAPKFEVGLFADNIFDKYAITAISNDVSSYNQVRTDIVERYYSQGVLTPRRVGVELRYHY